MKSSLVFLVSWWLIPACSGDDDGGSGGDWPDKLYLAPDGAETAMRFVEVQPEPY